MYVDQFCSSVHLRMKEIILMELSFNMHKLIYDIYIGHLFFWATLNTQLGR